MECNVVRDLIPLYIDDCCSKESAALVKEHLESCSQCNEIYESMKMSAEMPVTETIPIKMNRINDWKASIMQSVLLFISFGIITLGVAWEASTSSDGIMDGFAAINIVVPATGFMLSLANWYFVRLYKSRRSFSNWSWILTLGITMVGYIWTGFHYEIDPIELLQVFRMINLGAFLLMFGRGLALIITGCALSKVLSNQYAKMLGKE